MTIRFMRSLSFFHKSIVAPPEQLSFSVEQPLVALQELSLTFFPIEEERWAGCTKCGKIDPEGLMFINRKGDLNCCVCSTGPHELVKVDSLLKIVDQIQGSLN